MEGSGRKPKLTSAAAAYKNPNSSNYARIPDPTEKQTTKIQKENKDMSNTNNSNRLVVPGAREAMDKFKMEAANDFHVPMPS